jgi:hypothetical protein
MSKNINIYFILFIFLIGPPAFRNDNNFFSASSGSQDIWLILKVITYLYLLYKIYSLNSLIIKENPNISIVDNKLIKYGFLIIIINLIISSLLSDKKLYSFTYTIYYSFGFYFYIVLTRYFTLYLDDLEKILKNIRNIFSYLIIFTIFFSFFFENYFGLVYTENFIRLSGAKVSDFKFIPLITFLICMNYHLFKSESNDKINLFFLFISIIGLYLGQTRSSIFLALFFFLIMNLVSFFLVQNNNKIKNKKFFHILFFILLILFIDYSFIENIITRSNTVSITDITGRGTIWDFVLVMMKESFFGFGISAGFKDIFQSLPSMIILPDGNYLLTQNIGNSHNFYLDMLVAGGWISFFLISLIHLILNYKNLFLFNKNSSSKILFILFFATTIAQFFDNNVMTPSSNSYAFYWVLLALITANYNLIKLKKKN